MRIVTDLLLVIAVASVWLGCLGFVRLRGVYDRLHCVTFVSMAAGIPVGLAAWTTLGFKASMLKIAFLVVCAALNGAAIGHATGRALHMREQDDTTP